MTDRPSDESNTPLDVQRLLACKGLDIIVYGWAILLAFEIVLAVYTPTWFHAFELIMAPLVLGAVTQVAIWRRVSDVQFRTVLEELRTTPLSTTEIVEGISAGPARWSHRAALLSVVPIAFLSLYLAPTMEPTGNLSLLWQMVAAGVVNFCCRFGYLERYCRFSRCMALHEWAQSGEWNWALLFRRGHLEWGGLWVALLLVIWMLLRNTRPANFPFRGALTFLGVWIIYVVIRRMVHAEAESYREKIAAIPTNALASPP